MGWEQRGNNQYYYKKEREGSRVRSVYIGVGDLANLSAELLALEQEDRRLAELRKRQRRQALEALDAEIDALSDVVSTMTQATMIAAGFHQHKRQWRRKRGA
jgi:hypothetical protein